MNHYPELPGFKTTQPETSVVSAAAVLPDAASLREECFAALKTEDLTADEVAGRIGVTILSVRPRISELRAMGRVEPTKARRKNTSGHSACVWRAVQTIPN